MDVALFESLLEEAESETLDFKRDAYPFVGATDDEKGELLKDLLAFANAWRRSEAYILVGVAECPGARAEVVGVASHPDDASLQQFVNSKTVRPLNFSYEAFSYEGKQVGVLRIEVQERPAYIARPFGRLLPNTVYLRRGSSTVVATPEEIARIGAAGASRERAKPVLSVSIAPRRHGPLLGTDVKQTSIVYTSPPWHTPPRVPYDVMRSIINNERYYDELFHHVRQVGLLQPYRLAVVNSSAVSALDVRVEIIGPLSNGLIFLPEREWGEPPDFGVFGSSIHDALREARKPQPDVDVTLRSDSWAITASLGTVHPQGTIESRSIFYVGSEATLTWEGQATVFARDSEPSRATVRFDVIAEPRPMKRADVWLHIERDVPKEYRPKADRFIE